MEPQHRNPRRKSKREERPMTKKAIIAEVMDPSKTNLGNVGVALVAAARKSS